MEQWQDSISNSRFLTERERNKLTPMVKVKWPSKQSCELLRQQMLEDDSSCFSFEAITSQPAGLYLFVKFASKYEPCAKEMLNMMEEVIHFKSTPDMNLRFMRAELIYDYYLSSDMSSMKRQSVEISPALPNSKTNTMLKDKKPNRVGATETQVQMIKKLLDSEADLRTKLGKEYGEVEAGFHFCGYNPSLFDDILTSFMSTFRKIEKDFLETECFQKFLAIKLLENHVIQRKSFSSYRILGRGGFGEVYAQKRIETGKIYAVKLLEKSKVKFKRSEDLCWNEYKALIACKSPFVVNLNYAYQTQDTLFLALDFMSGGDLCYHLNKSPTGRFPPIQARFHAAEILLGIKHLHDHGYVYRDLKPDNVLLDSKGHCKISDLGLAIRKDQILSGTAGTLGYMAPEMFRRNEYGEFDPQGMKGTYTETVDWWSFGCLVYEMNVGKCPFRTSKAKAFYQNTFGKPSPGGNPLSYRYATCGMDVDYGSSVFNTLEGKKLKELIQGCLNRDPLYRYGASEMLFHQMRYHPWFVDYIDVNKVANKSLSPIFVPKQAEINSETIREIMKEAERKHEVTAITPEDQEQWVKWYYFDPMSYQREILQLLKAGQIDENGTVGVEDQKFDLCTIS